QRRDPQAEGHGQPQGFGRMGENHALRQVEKLAQRVARLAGEPGVVLYVHEAGPEAEPEQEAGIEAYGFTHPDDLVHHLTCDEAEVGHAPVVLGKVGEVPEHFVEAPGLETADHGARTYLAPGHHAQMSLFHRLAIHAGDLFRTVLEIAVHDHDPV